MAQAPAAALANDAGLPTEASSGADPLLLPEEMVAQIFTYLTPQELCRICLVSKGWKRAAEDDTVWMDLLSETPDHERFADMTKWFFLVKTRALRPRLQKAHAVGYLVNDNSTYEGELQNGFWNGYGAVTWPDSEYYQGEFSKGMIHGRGFKRYTNGSQFDGEWVRNQRKEGVMLFKSGNSYEGFFTDGRFHGKGVFRWKNGDQFEGDFADGKMGRGTLTLSSGAKHTGEVKNALETVFDEQYCAPPYPAPAEPSAT